jgi:hypothetical protein
MTKVILSQAVLNYRREMAEAVSDTIKASFIDGVKPFVTEERFLTTSPELLPPPKIEVIELTNYQGNIGDLIFLATSADFGIWNLHVVIRDDKGNVIESGDASPFEDAPDCWDYVATVAVPSGTSVTVYATATDRFWGVGALRTTGTIP